MNINLLKEKLNIDLNDENVQNIKSFVELFNDCSSHTNLMSKNDLALIFEKHIFDSLAFNLFIEKYKPEAPLKLLDMGTGGGFPSIPISIFFSSINVTALDSTKKKIDFINTVKTSLSLINLNPVCKRIEELEPSNKGAFDIVTTRALSSLNVVLEYALPYLKEGGYFIAYKSKNIDEEILKAKNALKILGAKIIDKIEYKLPLENDFTRFLLIIKKEKPTPSKYPRLSAIIKKMPL